MPGNIKCVVKHLKPKSLEPEVLDEAKNLFERKAETLYKLGNDSNQIQKIIWPFPWGKMILPSTRIYRRRRNK